MTQKTFVKGRIKRNGNSTTIHSPQGKVYTLELWPGDHILFTESINGEQIRSFRIPHEVILQSLVLINSQKKKAS